MSSGRVVNEADLRAAATTRARAEAAEVRTIVRYRDAEEARIARLNSPMLRVVERSGIALSIGQATGRSDGQAINLLAMVDRVIECLPQTWDAFALGEVDLARVTELSRCVEKLHRDESKERLDDQGPA